MSLSGVSYAPRRQPEEDISGAMTRGHAQTHPGVHGLRLRCAYIHDCIAEIEPCPDRRADLPACSYLASTIGSVWSATRKSSPMANNADNWSVAQC